MLSQNQDLLKPFAFTPLLVPLTKEETVPAFDIPIFRMWFFLRVRAALGLRNPMPSGQPANFTIGGDNGLLSVLIRAGLYCWKR